MRPTPINPSSTLLDMLHSLNLIWLQTRRRSLSIGLPLCAFPLNDVEAEIDDLGDSWLAFHPRQQQLGALAADLGAGNQQCCDHRVDVTQQVDVVKARYRKLRRYTPAAPLAFQKRADRHDIRREE